MRQHNDRIIRVILKLECQIASSARIISHTSIYSGLNANYLPISHLAPKYLRGQIHVYKLKKWLTQLPPFKQGWLEQSSMSVTEYSNTGILNFS